MMKTILAGGMIVLVCSVGWASHKRHTRGNADNPYNRKRIATLRKNNPKWVKNINLFYKKNKKKSCKEFNRSFRKIEDFLESKIIMEKRAKYQKLMAIKLKRKNKRLIDNKIFIKGFRKIKLGETIDITGLKPCRDPNTYIIVLNGKYFESVVITVTPSTHRVYKIWVQGYFTDRYICKDLFLMIIFNLNKTIKDLELPTTIWNICNYVDKVNNRRLSIQVTNDIKNSDIKKVSMFYTDAKVYKDIYVERNKILRPKADKLEL